MSDFKKHKHEHKNEQVDTEEEDKWNPTPEQFTAYQLRDAALCTGNLRMLLTSRPNQTLKELKDSSLHTAQTIEAQVSEWFKTGVVVESKGRYSLAPTKAR